MIVYTRYLHGCGLEVWLSVFLCLKWWEVCFFEEKWSDDQALIKLFFPLWVTIQIVASLWKCWKIYEKCRDDKNSCLCYRSVTGYVPLAGTVSFFLCKKIFNSDWQFHLLHWRWYILTIYLDIENVWNSLFKIEVNWLSTIWGNIQDADSWLSMKHESPLCC